MTIETATKPSATVRVAAVSFMLDAGFGVAMPLTLAHLARRRELPMTPWGFRAFDGPFTQLGPERFGALGASLVAVCALNVVAGAWLWQGRRRGAMLGLALTPATLGLAAGFALPFLLVPVPLRAALVLARRNRLT
jgi:hypothetical protein